MTDKNNEIVKDLNFYKLNAEEDYMATPISVLRYITELESNVANETGQTPLQLKERLDEVETFIKNILQEESLRDQQGMNFFLSDANILPNGDMTSFLYGAKKYNDYLQIRISSFLSEQTKKQ